MVTSVLLGTLVGVVMGLTGAGGGILAVPLLVFVLHLSVADAGPVGLLAVGTAAAVSAILGLRAKVVRYRAALLIAGSGILTAPLGVWLAHRSDTRLMSVMFAAVLGWVAYKTLKASGRSSDESTSQRLPPPCLRNERNGRFMWTSKCAGALSVAGAVAGVLSGLLGVGGGFVMVPALQRYTDLPAQSVVATSLAVIALVSLTGVAVSLSAGVVNFGVALPFAAGSVLGGGIGSVLTARLAQTHIQRAFGLICIVVAV